MEGRGGASGIRDVATAPLQRLAVAPAMQGFPTRCTPAGGGDNTRGGVRGPDDVNVAPFQRIPHSPVREVHMTLM